MMSMTKFKEKHDLCFYNTGINCGASEDACWNCGWNPKVCEERVEKLTKTQKKKMKRRNGPDYEDGLAVRWLL